LDMVSLRESVGEDDMADVFIDRRATPKRAANALQIEKTI